MRLRTLILASVALALLFACGKTPEPEPKPESKPTTVPVTSVSLNKSNLTLEPGGSETLMATVAPSNATDKTVTWSTSNSGVATVENGKVTAVKEGEASITAKAGEKTATCKVVVRAAVVPVESVTLNKTELTLEPGSSETLTATVSPENATDKNVTWSTSNAEVATVEGGKVTAIKEGEATISATVGGQSANCNVVVVKYTIAITQSKLTFLVEGGIKDINITCNGDWALSGATDWCQVSSDSGVGDSSIRITTLKNQSAQERETKLVFRCHGESAILVIKQLSGSWTTRHFVHRSLCTKITSVNCPDSKKEDDYLDGIEALLPNRFYTVVVHGERLGYDYLSINNVAYLEGLFFGGSGYGYPTVLVDQRIDIGVGALVKQRFINAVEEQEKKYPAQTGIEFTSVLSTNTLSVEGKVYIHKSGHYKLSVFILEDGIIGPQAGYYGDITHNNILRLSLTDILGDKIVVTEDNKVQAFNYSINLPGNLVKENLSILVFVQRMYDDDQPISRTANYGDYYVDNCHKAPIGESVELELYGYISGEGDEGIEIGEEIVL